MIAFKYFSNLSRSNVCNSKTAIFCFPSTNLCWDILNQFFFYNGTTIRPSDVFHSAFFNDHASKILLTHPIK